ncbi:MAG: immunoglobulin domain-containing protein [Sphingobacteriales bacterium JAD_PAG50586_3]|nr:MAG: immunoglobulin domain-containing protein [Sphingobacteriales bacterium JAD_PAG50586_3]
MWGQSATFSVTAAGTNIAYQWKRNNVNVTNGGGISGATTNQLTITNVAAGNAGTYTCQVSNTCATPTSTGALLTVNENTAIGTQPVTQTLCAGANLTLTVGATGTNLNYQWKRGTTNVGTNSPTLTINGITTGDAGNYTCEVTGACGNVTSGIAVVTVNTVTAINNQPAPTTTLCQGGNINLSTTAVGTNLSYQWKRGNTNVGTNSASLSIPNATVNDAGTYTVTITGACGTVTSTNAVVTVNPTTAITTAPVAQNGCVGSNITFSVVATGANLSYQWKKAGAPVGTDAPTLTLNNITLADAANYTVDVTGTCGPVVTSNAVALSVVNSASIAQQPQAQQLCVGGSLTLTVIGNGGNNTTYQWRRNGNNVGTSSATYTVPVTTANDLGSYDVVITGSCGTVTSTAVNVTAITPTSINNIATSQQLCIGESLALGVSANGENLSYQWLFQGSPIDNESGTSLVIDSITAGNAGLYSVTVTGDCGTVTGNISTIATTTPPAITGLGLPLAVCAGNAIFMGIQATGDNLVYRWQKNGVDIPNANQTGYTEVPANGDVFTVFVSNICDTVSHDFTAVVNPLPVPIVSQITGLVVPGILITQSGFTSYQWLNNGAPLPNSNNDTISVDNNFSSYSVIVTTSDGCSDTSAVYFWAVSSITENTLPGVSIYPNPSSSDVYFTTPANMGTFNVKIISTTGQLVMDKIVENKQLNIGQLPSGLYTVLVTYQGKMARVMLMKE